MTHQNNKEIYVCNILFEGFLKPTLHPTTMRLTQGLKILQINFKELNENFAVFKMKGNSKVFIADEIEYKNIIEILNSLNNCLSKHRTTQPKDSLSNENVVMIMNKIFESFKASFPNKRIETRVHDSSNGCMPKTEYFIVNT